MKNALLFSLAMLPALVFADTVTVKVTPPTTREDGKPLKVAELSQCRLWNVTDAKNKRLLSDQVLVQNVYTFTETTVGTNKYSADCTDTAGQVSKASATVQYIVKEPVVAVPEVPVLTADVTGNQVKFTVEPPSKRIDGSPLKKSDLLKCGLFNTTDPKNYKTISMDLLGGPVTYTIAKPGDYRFGAKCYDLQNRASMISFLRKVLITEPAKECDCICP